MCRNMYVCEYIEIYVYIYVSAINLKEAMNLKIARMGIWEGLDGEKGNDTIML